MSLLDLSSLPKPKGKFLLGNLIDFRFRTLDFLDEITASGQPIIPLRIGKLKAILLNEPSLIEQVMVHDQRNFVKARLGTQEVFGNGLLVSEGDHWLRQRRMMQPAFHWQQLEKYSTIVVEHAERTMHRWTNGETRDIQADMSTIAIDIVAKSCFNLVLSDEDKALIAELLDAALQRSIMKMSPLSFLQQMPLPPNRRFRSMLEEVDQLIFRFIKKRRELAEQPDDLLTLLFNGGRDNTKLSDRELRDEIWTILMTGHETTAVTMTWTWMLLAQYPEVQKRVQEELRSVFEDRSPDVRSLAKLTYTHQVIRESMRLHPTGWIMGRRSITDCGIGDYHVPKDTFVLMSQWTMHRSERWFTDPLRFHPERWTDELEASLPKFVFFPFGGGPHKCIGDSFATMEVTLVLATIAQHFTLSLPVDHKLEMIPRLTLRPKHGMPMTIRKR